MKQNFICIWLIFISCNPTDNQKVSNKVDKIWFQQEYVDLGAKIDMLNENFGVAISRGKGNDVSGKVYLYKSGIWNVISEHSYSDFPLIHIEKPNLIYWITHNSHHENYKPHMKVYDFKSIKELKLPPVMWDERDFVMWRGFSFLQNGKIYLAGQQGNIIYYDNKNWLVSNNPYKRKQNEHLNANDLHDIQMINDNLGWAVGKNGLILCYKNGIWEKYPTLTQNDLMKVSFVDENFGYAVGSNGTILKYDNGNWIKISTNVKFKLNSVKVISKNKAYIVGDKSTLLELVDGNWVQDESIKIYNDNFEDLDVIEKDDKVWIWIIGNNGIYTNYHDLRFSFSDVTSLLSIRNEGQAGNFIDYNNDGFVDLLTYLEESPSILYKNNGGKLFLEAESFKEISSNVSSQNIVSADFDNDGYVDLLDIVNNNLYFGNGNFEFRKIEDESFIKNYNLTENTNVISAQAADFDNDGNIDVYVSFENYDLLLKNNGAGKFENVFQNSGIKKFINNNSLSFTLSDFNNDNLIDILFTYKIPVNYKHIFLYLNQGNFKFTQKDDPNFYSLISPSTYSSIANDFNNDGYTDLLIFNNESELKLLINDGKANFIEMKGKAGLTGKFFYPYPTGGILAASDVNNDGLLDLFIGSKLYLNSPEFRFNEIGKTIGLNFTGTPAFADYDNDGDMDLFIGSSKLALGEGNRAIFYRNNSIINNFLKVKLYGDISNRFAIGAKVYLLGYNKRDSLIYITLRQNGLGGNSLSKENFSELQFGINPNYNYKVKVIFPSGIERTIEAKINSINEIYESRWLERQAILLSKYFIRVTNLIYWQQELIKFLVTIAGLYLILNYNSKVKNSKKLKRYTTLTLLIIYFVLLFCTINFNLYARLFFPPLCTGGLAFIFVFVSAKVIERKESNYISHYKILEVIGVGGTGKVLKVKDIYSSEIFALKIINPILLNDDDNRKLIANEAKVLASINNENIVKVFELGETQKYSYMVMEYLGGGTLDDYIKNNFPIENEKIILIARQICNGLKAIHEKDIVHRDLKTTNIMFDRENKVKIMDFGLSKSPLVTTMTTLGTIMGTLGYVAPEQITNIQVDKRADIFSLGVILYQMATNKLPFVGSNEIAVIHSIFNTEPVKPSEINPAIDNGIEHIIMKCLKKNQFERYQSVEEILIDIETLK